ncbi:MAG: 2-oxoacid:acceptor oxidoreductase family protein [Candidatus Scalindua sediminis]|nr:2-oxoacid:acceptor oxidoreductase family protein [Candidatus Scalindua sediminis]
MTEKVILAGLGGQGMMLLGRLIAQAVMLDGKNVTFFPSYGTEVRGGTAHYHLIVSEEEIFSPVIEEADTLIMMNLPSYLKFKNFLKPNSLLFLNSSMIDKIYNEMCIDIFRIPATKIANDLGNVVASNMVMLGAYNAVKNLVSVPTFLSCLKNVLKGKKAPFFEVNKLAIERGAEFIKNSNLVNSHQLH